MKTIRILVSSPSDVTEERIKAREVIHRLQRRYIGQLELIPVLWEEMALSVDAPFQEGIESILDRDNGIDIAVFILWSRLGSPLGNRVLRKDGSQYRSGTEREFELMLEAREEAKLRSIEDRPSILAYFRDDDPGFKQSLLEQPKEKIEEHLQQERMTAAFIREHFFDSGDGTNKRAYTSFESPSTFGHRLRMHLQGKLDDYLKDFRLLKEGWDTSEKGAPYRGLEVFDFEHAEIFFGREQETSDIQIALEKQAARSKAFILLLGASGSGKSSLARAGVIPAIQYYDTSIVECRYGVFTPGQNADDLFLGLAQTIASSSALSELAQDAQGLADFADTLRESPQSACKLVLRPLFKSLSESRRGAVRLVLLIDQLEELFTHTGICSESVKQFAEAVKALVSSGSIWVLATMRSDFYSKLQQYPEWIALKEGDGQYDALAPRPAHIHRIITEPAWLAGLQFEEDPKTGENLDQRILNDAIKHPEALPLLEFALRELYEIGSDNGILEHHEYEALGGVEGALGKRAEEIWQSLPPKTRESHAPRLFRALCTVDDEQEFTSKALRLNDQQEQNAEFIHSLECFVKARLLISSKSDLDDRVQVKLAHEALIRSWPRLNQWLIDSRDFLLDRARLESALKRWNEENQSHDFLLPEGKPLSDAQTLETAWRDELNSEQLDYISRSVEHNENRRKKRLRRYQMASGVLLIFAVLAIIGGIFAWQQRSLANERADEYRIQKEKADDAVTREKAESKRAIKAENAALLASNAAETEKFRALEAEKAATVLLKEASRSDYVTAHGYFDRGRWREGVAYLARSLRYDPENQLALEALCVSLINGDRNSAALPALKVSPEGVVFEVKTSPDNTKVIKKSNDELGLIRQSITGLNFDRRIIPRRRLPSTFLSPDGTLRVSKDDDGTIKITDTITRLKIASLPQQGHRLESIEFSPDGTKILTVCNDNLVYLWDSKTGLRIGKSIQHQDSVLLAKFSDNGIDVITADKFGVAHIWRPAYGKEIGNMVQHEQAVQSAKFSPDGTRLFVVNRDQTFQSWETSTGEEIGIPIKSKQLISKAKFSFDGKLVYGLSENTVQVWDALTGESVGSLMHHEETVAISEFSPNGDMILTVCSGSETGQIWDTMTGRRVGNSLRADKPIGAVEFSPKGYKVFTLSSDKITIRVWDAITGESVGSPIHGEEAFDSVNFSTDGKRILTYKRGIGSKIQCWNIFTGEIIDIKHPDNLIIIDPNVTIDTSDWASVGMVSQIFDDLNDYSDRKPIKHKDFDGFSITSSNGSKIATFSRNRNLQIWDTETGEKVGSLKHQNIPFGLFKFSPDGSKFVTSISNSAQVWDTNTGLQIGTAIEQEGPFKSFNFSPGGNAAVSISGDGTVSLWTFRLSNFEHLQELAEFVSGVRLNSHNSDLVELSAEERFEIWEFLLPFLKKSSDWMYVAQSAFPSDPRSMTCFNSSITKREMATRMLLSSNQERVRFVIGTDPGHPLLQIALAQFEEHPLRAKFLNDYGVSRLGEDAYFCRLAVTMLVAQGDMKRAAIAFEKAFELEPDHPDTLELRASIGIPLVNPGLKEHQ